MVSRQRGAIVHMALNSNTVWSILEDKGGTIWIGTEAGICLYDGKTFTPIPIPLRKDLPPKTKKNTHDVFNIMQDKSGKFWFATIDGVYIYDGQSFTPFIVKKDGPGFMSSNHNVENRLEDKAGNIWFGGRDNEGVYRYDGKSITSLEIKEPNFSTGQDPA
jgi:ligand-binding sensor domain-containing protein